MTNKFDRFDAYLARKQAQQRRRAPRIEPNSVAPLALPDSPVAVTAPPAQTAQEMASSLTPATRAVSQEPLAVTSAVEPLQLVATSSLLQTRQDAQWRRDIQILALHQKMLEKLQQQPHRVSEFLDKLEQRKLHGRIRHGEYLFWFCALSQWQHQAQAIASLLSMEPGPRKYRRRTLLAGLLTETERQQILFGLAP